MRDFVRLALLSALIVVGIALFAARPAFAQARKPAQASKNDSAGKVMTVKTGSAIVFAQPDMDADSLAYLNAGDDVRVSKKIYSSSGGHTFYKIALPGGKFGYVATIDVAATKPAGKPRTSAKSKSGKAGSKRIEQIERVRQRRELAKPMMYNTWFGALLGKMTFKEKVPGVKAQDDLFVYGFKITGPDVLLQGPLMDLNFTLFFGAPLYYQALSRVKPSGFIFTADTLLLMPLGMGQNSGLYLGLGPWFKYSNFKYVTQTGRLETPSKFGLGGSFAAGGAYRMGAVSVRLEGKYILEQVTHQVIQVGVQTFY